MEQSLFRKESLDKISAPDQLNEYIKIIRPGIWMILASIIIILVGACIWGCVGHMDTKVQTAAVVRDHQAVCYVPEQEIRSVSEGMPVEIGETKTKIVKISEEPLEVTGAFGDYAIHLGNYSVGDWVYEAYAETDLKDGTYQAEFVVNSEKPVSFLLN